MAIVKAADIIRQGIHQGASDVHLVVNCPPMCRINGKLMPMFGYRILNAQDIKDLTGDMIPSDYISQVFVEKGEVDFALNFAGVGRTRVNLYCQSGCCAVAVRIIPLIVPTLQSLGLPPVTEKLLMREKGLFLVTGTSGSGKSTSLAGMLDHINHTRGCHIITLEDPVEYLHQHGTCIINQREVGSDTLSFAQGLRAALRQDPDIIMVGEMRDADTISIALTAAETGHLVLASIHSGNVVQTLERIIDLFPPHQQNQVRMQLASTLVGVINQQLIPSRGGDHRLLVAEIMVMNSAIRNMIRTNKFHQIYSAIQTGGSQGMVSMQQALQKLSQQNKISTQIALQVGEAQGIYP